VQKNITLSAEERLIDQARTRARREKKSLNTVFREWLQRYAGSEVASDQYQALMRRLKHVSSGQKFSREELNER